LASIISMCSLHVILLSSKSHCDWRSISKFWYRAPSVAHDQIFITLWQLGLVFMGRPLWREDGLVFYICCWPSPAYSFSAPSPFRLMTVFYCLRLEKLSFSAPFTTRRVTVEVFEPASTWVSSYRRVHGPLYRPARIYGSRFSLACIHVNYLSSRKRANRTVCY
jgi:hypothetical protein